MHLRFLAYLAGCLLPSTGLFAQDAARSTVLVRDQLGGAVPYALVQARGGVPQIADDSGRATLAQVRGDSLALTVRRIGYRPFDGWAHRTASEGFFVVQLPRIAAILDTVRVTAAAAMTPLANRGFYDRVRRVKRGAYTAEFITPEELDARDLSRLSDIFTGRRYTRTSQIMIGGARQQRRASILLGRGGCSMTILLDGHRVSGTSQDLVSSASAPTSINPAGSRSESSGVVLGLDDIVEGHAVMGIEIYPSTANAPAELIPIGGRGSCGFVAIWTGARR